MNRARYQAITFLLLLAVLISNCTKIDTTKVGAGLIPGVDNIHTFDTTFSVVANNFDAVTSCDSISSRDLLASGIITDDPLFGRTRAEMYFELKPSNYPVKLHEHDSLSIVIDSVVLVLKYSHSYGDTNTMQKLTVHELADHFASDSVYRTCNPIQFQPSVLGAASFTPTALRDSIHGIGEDDANQLRIRLDNSFGENFIANISGMTNDSLFRQLYKGFAVVPDDATGGNAINYFDLTSDASRLSIYMTSKRDTLKDTAAVNLRLTTGSVQANFIERSRQASEITNHLSERPEGDSLIFLQAFPSGSYATLKVPGLNGFPNSVINRAELIIEEVYDPAASLFYAPRFLYLDIPDSSGSHIPIPCDFTMNQLQGGFPHLGGIRSMVTNSSGQKVARYTFNLSRYVQTLVTRKEENVAMRLRAPFYIVNSKGYVDRCNQEISPFYFPVNGAADGGVKLSGTNQTDAHIRMRVVYSKL